MSTAMMAMTTSSSISVKPRRQRMARTSPAAGRPAAGANGTGKPLGRPGAGKGRSAEAAVELLLDDHEQAAAEGHEVGHQLPGQRRQVAAVPVPPADLALDQGAAQGLLGCLEA